MSFRRKAFRRRSLLHAAGILEQKSEHPLAKAVLAYVKEQAGAKAQSGRKRASAAGGASGGADGLEDMLTDFMALPGNGPTGVRDGRRLYGGNLIFIEQHVKVPDAMKRQAEQLAMQGKTPLFLQRMKVARRNRRGGCHQGGQPACGGRTAEHGNLCGDADRRQ